VSDASSIVRPLRIVVVDDPLGSAHALCAAIEAHGFAPTVREIHSRSDLDGALAEGPCDLVLLAALHPDGLGDVVLDLLAGHRSAPPIVFVAPGEVPGNTPAVLDVVRRGAREYLGSDDVVRFAAAIEREVCSRDRFRDDVGCVLAGTGDPSLRAELVRDQVRLLGMQKMEAIGRLAGGIAHDFNNIVQAIGGFSEVLLRDLDETDARRRPVEEIRRAGDRAASLTRQLLAFSRQQVLQPRILDLNHTVGTIDSLLHRLIGEDVNLRVSLTPDLWAVRADETQIEQVLMNLVVNARDAMPNGGAITIDTANTALSNADSNGTFAVVPGHYVRLAVSDTGVGMSPDVRARAFEPFFTTKPLGRGTGLGLSTVYGIVKQSGGYIWVDSALEKGTRVRVYLPRCTQDIAVDDRRPAARQNRIGNETVLVVEDEAGVRDLLQDWLESFGYRVLAAGNGVDALELSRTHDGRIDLLVADVVMPAMGGPALAERLTPARPELKIMYMSGYADEALGDRLLDPGIPFLHKPFTLSALIQKVREVLDE
jgi:signal transduction histidine kinase/CheY-like chemotaxis protein